MICRIWHGWTTPQNAEAYEAVVRGSVIPDIEARNIPGFRHIDLLRREAGSEVDSVRAFMGVDYAVSHVPAAARAVLSRFDARAAHCHVIEQRAQRQGGNSR